MKQSLKMTISRLVIILVVVAWYFQKSMFILGAGISRGQEISHENLRTKFSKIALGQDLTQGPKNPHKSSQKISF